MITPRPYLSFTQKKLWKQSPDRYVDLYVNEKGKFETLETRFGSTVAHALEYRQSTGDNDTDAVIELLPKLELMDKPTDVKLEMGKKKFVPLHGRMDTRKRDHSAFKEYKTGRYSPDGKPVWTQAIVDKDPQITFYATMCYLMRRKLVEDIELVWAVTDVEQIGINEQTGKPIERIYFTGEIKRFRTKRTMEQVINEMADMQRVWTEINERCTKEMGL